MIPRFRLLLLDVDGTLLTDDRRITPRTKSAIERVRAVGVKVSLATGRTFESARPYAAAVGADAPLILYNGARVQSPEEGSVLAEWRLDRALARSALDALGGWDVHVSLFHDEAIYIPAWSERARASAEKDGVTFVPAGDLRGKLDRDPLKIMIIAEPATLDRLAVFLTAHFAEGAAPPPAVVRTEPTYLEIWHRDASKAVAASWIAHRLGVHVSEVIAIGDSLNDLDLVRTVGLGVAMGNAHPDLKSAARRVTGTNAEDGVALVLEDLLP